MPRIGQSDEELMAAYQLGSEEAFRALYDRHSKKIFGYLMTRTRSNQLASDLTQETFVKIHKSKHLYNPSLPVLPWIFSITHSVMIDGFRKEARHVAVQKPNLDTFDSVELNQIDRAPESEGALLPFLASLPANQKVALEMRYVDEKTFEEIAASLKTSPLNVRQIISRGVKRLKELAKDGGRS
jgi:RNA polymerase sigma factor (sigma-70 family)